MEQKRLVEERAQLFTIIHQQNEQLSELNSQLEAKVRQRTEQLRQSFKKLENAHQSLNRQYTETIKTFARIIEMRPGIKSGHATFIAEVSHKVAAQMNMPESEKKNVLYAGLLLQIGKMRFADSLFNQAFFAMSSTVRDQYLSHAPEGEALLKNMPMLKDAATLIRYQFEQFNGSGYPEGRKGDDIPRGARILAVVRDYISYLEGSMTGQTMTVADVIGRLKNKKGAFYDPDVVDAFLQVLTQMEKQAARPVVEIAWSKLEPGMEIDEISYNGRMFLKDCIIDKAKIYEVISLREKVGDKLKVKVRLGDADHVA